MNKITVRAMVLSRRRICQRAYYETSLRTLSISVQRPVGCSLPARSYVVMPNDYAAQPDKEQISCAASTVSWPHDLSTASLSEQSFIRDALDDKP